ncbi:MAG: type I restriction enzyme HsdR N-terminal domain-containing protein [Bacteroidetes bacterium]|nr:type I restriction enzyme HsdR N-terminal domain-containing protein [Bacteroidota bacterium]MDA1333163.1 type I restriction enzyme HsdR N-terminal domain-containing protein [Bacteroidota bacterium]
MQDPVRNKKVPETPEERVRQAMLHHLIQVMRVPSSLIAVEKGIRIGQAVLRPDIIVHDRSGSAWMVVECKAPEISIDQSTFDQAANYNRVLSAPFLLVTNGTHHRCARISEEGVTFVDTLPEWPHNPTTETT